MISLNRRLWFGEATQTNLNIFLRVIVTSMPSRGKSSDAPRPLPVAVFHILVAVADRERHGYAIMQDIAARTDGRLRLSPGTLYGSIKNLLEEGLIEELSERPDPEDDDVRRRYYRITPRGRKVAIEESTRLAKLLRQARATGLAPKTA